MLSVAGFEVQWEQNLYGESARSQDQGVKEAEDEQMEACDADMLCWKVSTHALQWLQ